jgi:hypothetical protein
MQGLVAAPAADAIAAARGFIGKSCGPCVWAIAGAALTSARPSAAHNTFTLALVIAEIFVISMQGPFVIRNGRLYR